MLNTFRIISLLSVVFIALLCNIGCKPKFLPMSSVPSTAENRNVMAFMDLYKNAVEQHSVAEVMALVAPDFYESNGTAEAKDDYGYSQLEEKLKTAFSKVKDITLRYHVQKIEKKDSMAYVYYYFNEHILAELPAGEEWMAGNDVNCLILREKDKSSGVRYEIVSGL